MKNWKQETVDTYNKSAKELAEYFRGIGSRTEDIDLAISLCGNKNDPDVLEIGCGDGRDAKEIIERTKNYHGFDISKELIGLARKHVPSAKFEVEDANTFAYGKEKYDVIFAFASLLHLNKIEIQDVLTNVYKALKPGGVFFISLKLSDKYKEELKVDRFGRRMFYFYNPEIIKSLASEKYKLVGKSDDFVTGRNTKWFEIALKKQT